MRRGESAHRALLAGDLLGFYAEQMAGLRSYKEAANPDNQALIETKLGGLAKSYAGKNGVLISRMKAKMSDRLGFSQKITRGRRK